MTSVARATRRRQQLHERYDHGPLEVLAKIYRDRDWIVLRDRDGQVFTTFTGFVSCELNVSPAYARRCQQAIRKLILPIGELCGPAAAQAITLFDMENLGEAGAQILLDDLAEDPAADADAVEMRRRIGLAIAARRGAPKPAGQARSAAAEAIAAAVPASRSEADEMVVPPWATDDETGEAQPRAPFDMPAAPAVQPKRTAAGDVAPHPSALGAAVDLILAVKVDEAAAELADRITDLADAAVVLTVIRAAALAAA